MIRTQKTRKERNAHLAVFRKNFATWRLCVLNTEGGDEEFFVYTIYMFLVIPHDNERVKGKDKKTGHISQCSPFSKWFIQKFFWSHKLCVKVTFISVLISPNFVVTVFCHIAKFLLDADELVVLCHTVGT